MSFDGSIDISLTQDFELLHFTLELVDPANAIVDFFEFTDAAVQIGGSGANHITAFVGRNSLRADAGNDVLTGGVGGDHLQGGEGDDVLIGDISAKYFGNDLLEAGPGSDLLMGGGGSDTFVFRPGNGSNIIGEIDVDPTNPTESMVVGPDFDPLLDTLFFVDFGYQDTRELMSHIQEDVNGTATFYDQDTFIEFNGLTVAEMSAADVLFI